MKFQDSTRKQLAGNDGEEPETPGDFSCIDAEQMPVVFDFLNTFNRDIRETALVHLELCLHCRELADTVLKINRYLEPKSGHYLHAKTSQVAVEHNPSAETPEVSAETEPVP